MNRAKFLTMMVLGALAAPACVSGAAVAAIFPLALSALDHVSKYLGFAEYWMSLFRASPIKPELITQVDNALASAKAALERFKVVLSDREASTADVKAIYRELAALVKSLGLALEAAGLYSVEKKGFLRPPSQRSIRADGTEDLGLVKMALPPEQL